MKKTRLALAIIATLIVIAATGQTYIGAKTGINISNPQANLYVDALDDAPKAYTSFMIGATAEFAINDAFSFQPELQYNRKGFRLSEEMSLDVLGMGVPVGARATTRIDYIEMPLLAKVKMGNGLTNFYGVAGPAFGYALSGKIQPQVTVLIDFNLPEIDVNLGSDQYNRTEVSAVFGGGLEHQVGLGKIFADVRYQHSFTSAVHNTVADVSIRNSGAQLTVGYAHRF